MGRKNAGHDGCAANVQCLLGGFGWDDGGNGTACGSGTGGRGQTGTFTSQFERFTMTAFVAGFGGDRGEHVEEDEEDDEDDLPKYYTVGGGGGGVLIYGIGPSGLDGSGLVMGKSTAGRTGKGFGAGGGAGGYYGYFGGNGAVGLVYVEWG